MSRFANVGMLPPAMREQVEAKLAEQTRTVQLLGPPDRPGRKHTNGPRMKAVTSIVIPPELQRHNRKPKASDPTGRLLWQIRAHKIPAPEVEHRFHPTRKWRFDLAWPDRKLAAEVEGLTHEGGRHQRMKGYTEDCRKYMAALRLGWRVARVTPAMVRNGEAVLALVELFHGKPHA